jgi:glycosyltransferase involved in cell wall biosynthesis
MKIAIFHDLPSGGAKRTLYETMKRLSKKHILDVYTLDTADQDFCNLAEFSNSEFVFPFSPSKMFRSPLGRLNQLLRWRDLQRLDRLAHDIAKKIDELNYDVVLAQPCMWTQAPLVLRYLQAPSIYYCHEPPRHAYEYPVRAINEVTSWRTRMDYLDPSIRLYQKTAQRLDRLATRSASRVLVNSKFIQEQVKDLYGIEPFICYLGVDTEIFRPESNIGHDPYILSVGAIQPHKGYDFLIESFSYIDKNIRPALHLVGNMQNAGEQAALQVLANKIGVDLRIEVGINQRTLVQRYNKALFVAYAPYNEPFGLVPLEAMACGKPVVGVDEGGVKETVVHKSTGLLVERNARKFGESIQFLLQSPDLIERLGINGRRYVTENWSWEKAVDELERHLFQAAQRTYLANVS